MKEQIDKRKVMYDPRQLKAAVDFINENNAFLVRNITVEKVMRIALASCFKPDVSMVGAAGWYCSVSKLDDTITLDFLVDPLVSEESSYIIAEVIT